MDQIKIGKSIRKGEMYWDYRLMRVIDMFEKIKAYRKHERKLAEEYALNDETCEDATEVYYIRWKEKAIWQKVLSLLPVATIAIMLYLWFFTKLRTTEYLLPIIAMFSINDAIIYKDYKEYAKKQLRKACIILLIWGACIIICTV